MLRKQETLVSSDKQLVQWKPLQVDSQSPSGCETGVHNWSGHPRNVKIQSLYGSCEKIKMRLCESGHKYSCLHMKLFIRRASTVRSCLNVFTVANVFVYSLDKTVIFLHLCYTCQLFLRYKREIFILGVLGFLKTTRSFPKIPEEVRSLPKTSEVFQRRPKSSEDQICIL